MKKIEVSDEMYDNLINLANEMTSQDPRGTKMPHLFQIRTKYKVYDWSLNGNERIWIDRNGDPDEIESYEDLVYYLENLEIEIPENLKNMWEDRFDSDLKDFLNDKCPDLEQCSYSWEYKYENAFLTAKGCKDHIEKNSYHYNDPIDYLNCAWRNPEMELISKFLCGLVGKEPHK